MLESVFRANAGPLYTVYHALPSPVQNFLTSARGFLLARNRYSDGMTKYLYELRGHEAWNAEEIAQFQLVSLRRVLSHARETVPYYSEYPVAELNTTDDLRQFPVLTREEARANSSQFVSRSAQNANRIQVSTTGTTGASLQVSYSEDVARRNWAFHMRRWAS